MFKFHKHSFFVIMIYQNNRKEFSKIQAETIVFDYLNTNATLKKYIPTIKSNYTLKSDVLFGVKVWKLSFSLPGYDNFQFGYFINVNTGELILKTEPKLSGLTEDRVFKKRSNTLIPN